MGRIPLARFLCMQNVVELKDYKKKLRKTFLTKYKTRLDRFISRYIDQHLDVDLLRLSYTSHDALNGYDQEVSWDYVSFREVLAEALDQTVGKDLYDLLKLEPWFDAKIVTRDEIIERCLSDYILNQCQYAIQI